MEHDLREALQSGEVLLELKRRFLQDRTRENLLPLLRCLKDSTVLLPVTLRSTEEQQDHEDGEGAEGTMSLKPHVLKLGDRSYLPVFSNGDRFPPSFNARFTPVAVSVKEAILLAGEDPRLSGLVLDAFEEALPLEHELLALILQMKGLGE